MMDEGKTTAEEISVSPLQYPIKRQKIEIRIDSQIRYSIRSKDYSGNKDRKESC